MSVLSYFLQGCCLKIWALYFVVTPMPLWYEGNGWGTGSDVIAPKSCCKSFQDKDEEFHWCNDLWKLFYPREPSMLRDWIYSRLRSMFWLQGNQRWWEWGNKLEMDHFNIVMKHIGGDIWATPSTIFFNVTMFLWSLVTFSCNGKVLKYALMMCFVSWKVESCARC